MSNYPDGMSLAQIRQMEGDDPDISDDFECYDDEPDDVDDSWADQ